MCYGLSLLNLRVLFYSGKVLMNFKPQDEEELPKRRNKERKLFFQNLIREQYRQQNYCFTHKYENRLILLSLKLLNLNFNF